MRGEGRLKTDQRLPLLPLPPPLPGMCTCWGEGKGLEFLVLLPAWSVRGQLAGGQNLRI